MAEMWRASAAEAQSRLYLTARAAGCVRRGGASLAADAGRGPGGPRLSGCTTVGWGCLHLAADDQLNGGEAEVISQRSFPCAVTSARSGRRNGSWSGALEAVARIVSKGDPGRSAGVFVWVRVPSCRSTNRCTRSPLPSGRRPPRRSPVVARSPCPRAAKPPGWPPCAGRRSAWP
jgi:hypothetical protein